MAERFGEAAPLPDGARAVALDGGRRCPLLLKSTPSQAMVATAAGRLPGHSRRSTCQPTLPRDWCRAPPAILVMAANHRSVPTAAAGATPNSKTRMGVISEPPPTPVSPTSGPTAKPATALCSSIVR